VNELLTQKQKFSATAILSTTSRTGIGTALWENVEEETALQQSTSISLTSPPANLSAAQDSFKDLWLLDGVEAKTRRFDLMALPVAMSCLQLSSWVPRKRLTPLHCAVIGWGEWTACNSSNLCAKRAFGSTKSHRSSTSNTKKKIFGQENSRKLPAYGTVISILLQVRRLLELQVITRPLPSRTSLMLTVWIARAGHR
jgi:hypothetical protein